MKLTAKMKLGAAFDFVLLLQADASGLSYVKLSELSETQQDIARRGGCVGTTSDLQNALAGTICDADFRHVA